MLGNIFLRRGNPFDPTIFVFLVILTLSTKPIFSIFYNTKFSACFFLLGSLFLLLKYSQALFDIIKNNRQIALNLCLFNAWAWISGVFSDHQEVAIAYNIRLLIYALSFTWFLLITNRSGRNQGCSGHCLLQYHRLIFYFLSFLGLVGIIEYFIPYLWKFGYSDYFMGYYPRISSLVGNPNPLAVLMYLGFALGIILKKNRAIHTHAFYIGSFFLLTAGALAASRNGWIIFLLFMLLGHLYKIITARDVVLYSLIWLFSLAWFPTSIDRLLFVDGQFPALIQLMLDTDQASLAESGSVSLRMAEPTHTVAPVPESASTALARFTVWQSAFGYTIANPLTGIGNGAFKFVSVFGPGLTANHAHNLLLNIAVGMGIPGLVLFLKLLASIIQKIHHNKNSTAVLVVLVLTSQIFDFFGNSYTFMTISLYFVAFSCSDLKSFKTP